MRKQRKRVETVDIKYFVIFSHSATTFLHFRHICFCFIAVISTFFIKRADATAHTNFCFVFMYVFFAAMIFSQ